MVTPISTSSSPESAQPDPALSDAQLRANRRNARKSTGPRTPEGKAKSSKNALKHGVFSIDIVVEGEDPRQHSEFRIASLLRLNPRDAVELQFADQFIRSGWKLLRLQGGELELYRERRKNRQQTLVDRAERYPHEPMPELTPGLVLAEMLWAGGEFDRFQMYEQRLSNSMHRAINQLRKLQSVSPSGPPSDLTTTLIAREEESITKIENEPAATAAVVSEEPPESSVTPPPPALCQIPGPWFGKPGPWPLEELMYRPPKAPPAKPGS